MNFKMVWNSEAKIAFPVAVYCSWYIFFLTNLILLPVQPVLFPFLELALPTFPTTLFSCPHTFFHIHLLKHLFLFVVHSYLAICYIAKALGKASKCVFSNSGSEETRNKVKVYWHVHEDVLFSLLILLVAENWSAPTAYSSKINANYNYEFKKSDCFPRCKKLVVMHYQQLLYRKALFCYDWGFVE